MSGQTPPARGVQRFLRQPQNWLLIAAGLIVLATGAFVIFQPVKVVPRLYTGPEYALEDQRGQPVSDRTLAGEVVLYGFGYGADHGGVLARTVTDFKQVEQALAAGGGSQPIRLALVMFDAERDTAPARLAFAETNDLGAGWLVLGGEHDAMKRMIGQGFSIYYEALPLNELAASDETLAARLDGQPDPADYGYLQAERYILVDENNIVRAEYRAPLEVEIVLRDLALMERERNTNGAGRLVNEAAHLFLCYPG